MSQCFAFEGTFIPRRHPHEITNRRRGEALVLRINHWLADIGSRSGVWMAAKLDPHHNPYARDGSTTWLVEVTPIHHFKTAWLDRAHEDHVAFVTTIDTIITGMRKQFGLVSSFVTRKGNEDLHWPGGGGHLMMQADSFDYGTHWYRHMERFHRHLAIDYANRPYARWLLAHWIADDSGSRVVVGRDRLELARDTPALWSITTSDLFERMVNHTSAIEARFMRGSKAIYPTWECRIVGMVDNARQMCSAARLCNAWLDHLVHLPKAPRFNLTVAKWDSYTKEAEAREACRQWVTELGLDWMDYEEDHFQRNYAMRIKHGAFN